MGWNTGGEAGCCAVLSRPEELHFPLLKGPVPPLLSLPCAVLGTQVRGDKADCFWARCIVANAVFAVRVTSDGSLGEVCPCDAPVMSCYSLFYRALRIARIFAELVKEALGMMD